MKQELLIKKLEELKELKKSASNKKQKKEISTEIKKIKQDIEELIIKKALDEKFSPAKGLTEKQESYYNDIADYFENFSLKAAQDFLDRSRVDRKTLSGRELKVAVKKIGHLKKIDWSKDNFSELVEEYQILKNGISSFYIRHEHFYYDLKKPRNF